MLVYNLNFTYEYHILLLQIFTLSVLVPEVLFLFDANCRQGYFNVQFYTECSILVALCALLERDL